MTPKYTYFKNNLATKVCQQNGMDYFLPKTCVEIQTENELDHLKSLNFKTHPVILPSG